MGSFPRTELYFPWDLTSLSSAKENKQKGQLPVFPFIFCPQQASPNKHLYICHNIKHKMLLGNQDWCSVCIFRSTEPLEELLHWVMKKTAMSSWERCSFCCLLKLLRVVTFVFLCAPGPFWRSKSKHGYLGVWVDGWVWVGVLHFSIGKKLVKKKLI